MKYILIFVLAFTVSCQDDFKGDDRKKEPGVPPTIRIPDNLRIRVNITGFFNIAVGMDIVCVMLTIVI